MKREMDELLYEIAQAHGLTLTDGEMNYLIDGVMEIARSREDGAMTSPAVPLR